MCHADHPPPHFHASYRGFVALLRIADGTIIHGKLPIKAARIVPQWALDRHDPLMANWAREPKELIPGADVDDDRADPHRTGRRALELTFSDGSHDRWTADAEIVHDTVPTRPLADPAYFARAFIGAGALAGANGLEFAAHSLQPRMEEAGVLVRRAA